MGFRIKYELKFSIYRSLDARIIIEKQFYNLKKIQLNLNVHYSNGEITGLNYRA